MKDERITLETAKLAKNKNFNEFVNGTYTEYLVDQTDPEYPEGGGPFSMKKGEIEFDTTYIRNNDNNSDLTCKNYACYSAPTQSLLQKWLREVHNIHVGLIHESHGWMFILSNITENDEGKCGYDNYKTYEEALEAGFKKAFRDYIK
jgi:hypothetical protein